MNNPMQMLMNMLQTQLKGRNPQALKQVQQLQENKGDPRAFLNQITQGYTPEQMKQFRAFANNFGVTDEQLNQYGINIK